jgi:hypothetical protein
MVLAVIFAAALAVAQPAAPQRPVVTPSPQPAPVAPVRPAASTVARPAQSFAAGGIGAPLVGLQPTRPFGNGLVGLAPTGDPAPQCRATCAKAHVRCSGEEDCDTRWTQCLTACRTAK